MISFHGASGSQPPPPCNSWPSTSAVELFATAKLKQESKRGHQPRAYNRLKGPIPIPFHQSHACNKLVPSHKAAAALERSPCWHRDTCKHTQGSKLWAVSLYSSLWHVYEALRLAQIISVPHPPTDNSPNPFRGKISGCDCRVPPAYPLALLNYTLLNNQASLLVILLLQLCKRKKKVGFFGGFCLFFYDEAATVWRKPVLCTHRKAHTYFIWCIASCME